MTDKTKNITFDETTKLLLTLFQMINNTSPNESIEFIVCDYFKKLGIHQKIQYANNLEVDFLDKSDLEALKFNNPSKLKKLW